jgi:hypothetical protein
MRGVYTAQYEITGLSAAKTLMYITAPSSAIVEILSAEISNETNETNEQLVACFQRVSSLGTPTATTLTPSKHEAGDQAAASTVKANVTASEPSYSSNTEIGPAGFSSLGGWRFDPLPEERPAIAPSASLGLRLLTATNTSFDGRIRITFREIG